MKTPLKISVIVPTFARYEPLLDTMSDLLAQTGAEFEILVIDQNSDWPRHLAGPRNSLAGNDKVKWHRVHAEGVVAARQYAASLAIGDIFLFCDDDVRIPDKEFLARHLATYADDTIDAVCGREIVSPQANVSDAQIGSTSSIELSAVHVEVQPIIFPRNSRVRQNVCSFCTCNSSVRREAFMAVGGFDENFAGASYGDDYDFAVRLHKAGRLICFNPEAWLFHLQTPMGGLRLSDKRQRFSEADKALSGWIYLLRHGVDGWRAYLFWHWVLRRTVFLRRNFLRPWVLPRSVYGVVAAYIIARKAARNGPKSRFAGSLTSTTAKEP